MAKASFAYACGAGSAERNFLVILNEAERSEESILCFVAQKACR
jgi:hypothetical protein